MRDLDSIREQIEIRLEPRQIVALALGTMLFSGGLFATGFLVGQRQAQAGTAPVKDDLTRLGEAPAGQEPARHAAPAALGEVEFMFPSMLGSRPGHERAPAPSVRLPADVLRPAEAPEPPPVAEAPKPAPEPRKPAPEAPKPAPEALKPATEAPKATPPPRKAAAEAPKPAAVAAPADDEEDEDLPPGIATPKPAAEKATVRYTLQVKAVKEKADADAIVADLRRAGFDPYVVLADLPEQGRFYRIRMGRFDSMDEARAFQRGYKSKTGATDGGFVTEL